MVNPPTEVFQPWKSWRVRFPTSLLIVSLVWRPHLRVHGSYRLGMPGWRAYRGVRACSCHGFITTQRRVIVRQIRQRKRRLWEA